MKVITTGDIGKVTVYWKIVERVTTFVFLGAFITREGFVEAQWLSGRMPTRDRENTVTKPLHTDAVDGDMSWRCYATT